MVLDGASLLDVRVFERGARNAQHALDMLFARCGADAACHAAFPDPRADYARIAARLSRRPYWVAGSTVPFDRFALANAVDALMDYTPNKAAIPLLLHLGAQGQLTGLARVVAADPPTEQLAYPALIGCSERWAEQRPGVIAHESVGSFIAPLQRRSMALTRAACRVLPRGVIDPALGRRVRSRTPVLLLTGAEDTADPPANVAGARRELPNSRTVVFPAAGHGQLLLPCAQRLIAAFVEGGTAESLDASCARTAARRPFLTQP